MDGSSPASAGSTSTDGSTGDVEVIAGSSAPENPDHVSVLPATEELSEEEREAIATWHAAGMPLRQEAPKPRGPAAHGRARLIAHLEKMAAARRKKSSEAKAARVAARVEAANEEVEKQEAPWQTVRSTMQALVTSMEAQPKRYSSMDVLVAQTSLALVMDEHIKPLDRASAVEKLARLLGTFEADVKLQRDPLGQDVVEEVDAGEEMAATPTEELLARAGHGQAVADELAAPR